MLLLRAPGVPISAGGRFKKGTNMNRDEELAFAIYELMSLSRQPKNCRGICFNLQIKDQRMHGSMMTPFGTEYETELSGDGDDPLETIYSLIKFSKCFTNKENDNAD